MSILRMIRATILSGRIAQSICCISLAVRSVEDPRSKTTGGIEKPMRGPITNNAMTTKNVLDSCAPNTINHQ
jgi:hypothetical protein